MEDAQLLAAMEEEVAQSSAAEGPVPSRGASRLARGALIASSMLMSAGAVLGIRTAVKHSGVEQWLGADLMVKASAGPFDAWHIRKGHQDKVKSKTGVPYSLKHGKNEQIGNYLNWAKAQEATHGGAWMLTYQEDGKEYLCKTEPGPDTKIDGPDTYEAYWKPVYKALSKVHDIIDTELAQKVCEQSYTLYHVKHGDEQKSHKGIGYAVGHIVSRAGSSAKAETLKAGGAWMLTKKSADGEDHVCKTYPGPDTKVQNGDTWQGYWKPVFDGLASKKNWRNDLESADICFASEE